MGETFIHRSVDDDDDENQVNGLRGKGEGRGGTEDWGLFRGIDKDGGGDGKGGADGRVY